MQSDISHLKQRLAALDETYRALLNEEPFASEGAEAERDNFARIADKLDTLKAHLEAAERSTQDGGSGPVLSNGVQKRKQARVGRLQLMRSSMAGI